MADAKPASSLYERASREALRVAVTGGSGFIGTYIVLNLLQLGHHVHLLVHSSDPDYVSVRGRVQTFTGGVNDVEALDACFEGCDAVYHLVGIIAETKHKTFQETVVKGSQKVAAAAKRAGVGKLIYLSAIGASPNAASRYFTTKHIAEETTIATGLDYTIFRPSIVYGARDQFVNKLARIIKLSPVVPVFGDGRFKLQPVYVEELAALMIEALRFPASKNKIYEIGGPDQLTYLEIIDIIKRTLNVRRGNIHLPIPFMRMIASVMEKVVKPAPITVDQLNMLQAGSTCDHTIVEREFGVRFTPFEEQLQKYLGNYHG